MHCGNSAGTRDLARHEAQHVEFWDIMATLAEHELAEARRREEIDWARVWGDALPPHLQRRKAGWHTSINADVSSMLAGAHSWPCQDLVPEQCHLFLALPCERPAIMPPLMLTSPPCSVDGPVNMFCDCIPFLYCRRPFGTPPSTLRCLPCWQVIFVSRVGIDMWRS